MAVRIYRTAGSPTLNTKHTISMWFKRTKLTYGDCFLMDGYQDANNRFKLAFDAEDRLELYNTHGGSYKYNVRTNRKFRDESAFYHLVVRIDTTQASASDRVRVYVNGTEEESFNTYTDATQDDANNVVNESGATISIGDYQGGNNAFEGLMTHVHFVDGTSYGPDTFGSTDSTSGIWKPNTAPSVTYGNNGFFLKFENSGNMDLDSSGNNHTFTTSGTLTQNIDTPSNVFPNISKAMQPTGASNATISNGGLTNTSSSSDYTILCSMAAKKGKWYWEVKMGNASNRRAVGVVRMDKLFEDSSLGGFYPGGNTNSTNYTSAYTTNLGFIETNTAGSRVQVTSGVTNTTTDDIVGMYLDLDGYTLKFYKNGSLQNEAALNATWVEDFVAPCARADHNQIMHFNFGSGFFGTTAVSSANADANGFGAFEYSPTLSGVNYYAWCTKNIKEFG